MSKSQYTNSVPQEDESSIQERLGQAMNMGNNIQGTLDGDTLILTIDLSRRGGVSPSGKTIQVASTAGNRDFFGTGVIIGINVYVANPNRPR